MKALKLPFKLIFNKLTLAILLLFIQVIILTLLFKFFYDYVILLFGGISVFNFVVISHILIKNENTNYKIAWILLVLGFPGIGAILYIFVQLQINTKIINNKLKINNQESLKHITQDNKIFNDIEDEQVKSLTTYMNKYAFYSLYKSGKVDYFSFGEDMFDDLKKELEEAKEFIFLEYFIITKGKVLESIIEILKRKSNEGVEIRILYDGTCVFNGIPYNYPDILKQYKIKAKMFLPVKAIISTHQNNRDHRKIAIIDGKVAYTGGINIGDEYSNEKMRFGRWKDTAIKLRGNAVNSFTTMFLEMWNVDEPKNEDYSRYIKINDINEDGYIMPYGDNPLDVEDVGRNVYLHILNTAKRYVYIITPYLILDDELLNTIKYTAKRGVGVKIIMPHIPDKKFVYYLSRSYYEELIEAGVKIYEYEQGFVHAKMFISDDDKAVVGTINLDYRSLYLHFECGAYIYQNSVIKEIKEDCEETLEHSILITNDNLKKFNVIKRIIGVILRFFAPLM